MPDSQRDRRPRRRMAPRLLLGCLLGLAAGCLQASAATPATPPPSAIGQVPVFWLAVSPAYLHTGLVVAMSAQSGNCTGSCQQLWVTTDGGASWSRAAATGWSGGRPVIAVDGQGHETLWASSGNDLQRSDDDGQSWHAAADSGGGLPAPSPAYASDREVAVALGSHDYRLDGTTVTSVSGSGGLYDDFSFTFSPGYPSAEGTHTAALLSAIDSNRLPVVEQCGADLTCSRPTTLPGAGTFSAPAALLPAGDFATTGAVFAQTGRGIFKSLDGGTTFAPLAIAPTDTSTITATPMLALAPGYRESSGSRTAYAAVFQIHNADPKTAHTTGGVYRSQDGGTTWAALGSPSPLDAGSTAVAVAPDGRLFAGYLGAGGQSSSQGLLCSADGGGTWHATCPAIERQPATGGGPPNAGSGAGGAPAHVSTAPCGGTCPSTPAPASPGPGATGSGSNSSSSSSSRAGDVGLSRASAAGAGGSSSGRGRLLLALGAGVLCGGAGLAVVARRRRPRSAGPDQ